MKPFASTPADVEIPDGVDRRSFLMRSAVIGAAVVMTGLEEFYKVGPGPSSSHTIGPMRIT